ncbi:transcription elongation factor A protein 3 isoform X18 [Polyodon spathula]|uniref:transcription elongation factor A protein 3 isoform X18 n=1 Tax=Polyodon spathula TaxID=7913 RepID=UPI001B7F6DDD|nr:transcription elongation factor A protein 3 isoform X18 [Polyodon spathula]
MAREEELIRIAKKLDKMVSRNNMEGALDLLKELKAFKMTLKLLQGTRIGMSVNAVRKHCPDEEVITLAKILVKNWKRLLMESADAQKGELEKGEGNEKRREEISHSKPTSTGGPTLPTRQPDKEASKGDSSDSKSISVSPKKHPGEHKRERKDLTDSKSLPPKRRSLDTKKERKDSFDSTSATAIRRPSSDTKAEQRNPSDSLFSSTSTPLKKLSLDCKGERRDSHNSKPAIPSPPHRKPSTDSREERVNNGKGKVEPPKTPTSPTSPLTPSFSPSGGTLPPHLLTGETIRDKCIEMLSAALKTDDDYKVYGTNCESMAAEIEDHIYQDIKATDMKYKNRVRSRISNLKDPKNPNLRRNVLSRAIELSRIASMTADEMASDELKNLRNVLTQEAIREHQMAKTSGTTTDLLQCGKCKKKNCTYNQVQTRSADEPMTTFVLCNECGNRWKFC